MPVGAIGAAPAQRESDAAAARLAGARRAEVTGFQDVQGPPKPNVLADLPPVAGERALRSELNALDRLEPLLEGRREAIKPPPTGIPAEPGKGRLVDLLV